MRWPKLNELSNSEYRALFAGACFLVAVIVHDRIVSPYMASLRAAQRYAKATNTILDETKSRGLQLEAMRKRLDLLQAERASQDRGIFLSGEVDPFFNELERLAAGAQCMVVSFRHLDRISPLHRGPSDVNAPVEPRGARLTLQSRYDNITHLVEELQSYRRKVWIDRMKISSVSGASDVVCDLEISIYVHRNEENAGHEEQ
jgi:hypothetical protein